MGQGLAVQYVDPQGNSRQLQGQFFGTKYAAVTLNAAAGTTPQPLITAPAGMYVYVAGIQITIDPICTLASAGMINTTVAASTSGNLGVLRSYIPASAAAPTIPTVIRETSAPGNFWVSTTTGESITAVNSVALTAGSIRVSFNYGFSNVPIGN